MRLDPPYDVYMPKILIQSDSHRAVLTDANVLILEHRLDDAMGEPSWHPTATWRRDTCVDSVSQAVEQLLTYGRRPIHKDGTRPEPTGIPTAGVTYSG